MKLIIEGFTSKNQIEAFVGWFCNSGEQDLTYSLENSEHEDVWDIYINTDCPKTFPLDLSREDVTMHVKIYERSN